MKQDGPFSDRTIGYMDMTPKKGMFRTRRYTPEPTTNFPSLADQASLHSNQEISPRRRKSIDVSIQCRGKKSNIKSPVEVLSRYGIFQTPKVESPNYGTLQPLSEPTGTNRISNQNDLLKSFDQALVLYKHQNWPNLSKKQDRIRKNKKTDLLTEAFSVRKKELNKKFNYVNLDQLEKQETMFLELAQKRLKEFKERTDELQRIIKPTFHHKPQVRTLQAVVQQRKIEVQKEDFSGKYQQIQEPYKVRKRAKRAFTPWKQQGEDQELFK